MCAKKSCISSASIKYVSSKWQKISDFLFHLQFFGLSRMRTEKHFPIVYCKKKKDLTFWCTCVATKLQLSMVISGEKILKLET